MSEKPNENVKTLEISTGIEFDKDDVATIAVAEAEVRIRKTIKQYAAQVASVERLIEINKDKIINAGKTLVDSKFAQKIKTIKAGLVKTGIPRLDVTVFTEVSAISWNQLKESPSAKNFNAYSLFIVKTDKSDKQFVDKLTVEQGAFPATKEQRSLAKLIHDDNEKLTALKKESIDWRRKLSDIPMLERQVRAKLAKDHVSKTKEGKAMIEGLVNNFDETVKFLGM